MNSLKRLLHGWSGLSSPQRDFVAASAVIVPVYLAAWQWDLAESIGEITGRYEFIQLDELSLALFMAAIASAWFSRRRMRDLQTEVNRRAVAEQKTASLLTENRALAKHARQAQEDERKRMAREIHDEMGQYLTAIRLSAAILPAESDPLVAEHASRISQHAEHIQISVRELLHRLRPVALDEYGLMDAVRHLSDEWMQHNPQSDCELELDDNCPILPDELNIAVYRVVQEALTNVARHSRADRVEIRITCEVAESTPYLEILVSDNGVGFDQMPKRPCFGLVGMRERIDALGGSFQLHSQLNAGVTISARIPVSIE